MNTESVNGVASGDYASEQARILKERAKEASKAYKREQAKEKLLWRWPRGVRIRDKRTGLEYIYRGNADEDGTMVYIVEDILEYSNQRGLWHTLEPSKEIVKVGHSAQYMGAPGERPEDEDEG